MATKVGKWKVREKLRNENLFHDFEFFLLSTLAQPQFCFSSSQLAHDVKKHKKGDIRIGKSTKEGKERTTMTNNGEIYFSQHFFLSFIFITCRKNSIYGWTEEQRGKENFLHRYKWI